MRLFKSSPATLFTASLTSAHITAAHHFSTSFSSRLSLRPSLPLCYLNQTSSYSTMPAAVISVCHGGGPMPLLNDPGHKEMIKSMSERAPKVLGIGGPTPPRAIILVTAHWQARRPTISNGAKHKLYYDYGGFPPETYKIKYDAPGSPEVAQEVYDVLQKAGMEPEMDGERGVS